MNPFSKIAIGIAAAAGITTGVYYLSSNTAQEPFVVSQAIPASASVSASGMLTWTMDIEVPPGIQNIQPSLSINYTSQNVSGLLGVGFDLEGLSEITRTSATVAQDGFFGGVNFTNKDRFDVDGNRLMVMQGAYGTANSVYHTQLESWSKVLAVGQSGSGPQSFQLWNKNGLYFEYGNTTDSRVLALSATSPSAFANGSVRQWLVNKCRDLHGNTLTVSYTQTPPDSLGHALTSCTGQGQSYPLRIDYTSNDTVKALRSVQFIYETRPDSSMCFIGGAKFSSRARMTAIRTYVKDEKGDSVLVREVRITYQKNAPLLASRMASVQVRGGNCAYAPTTFNWSQGQDTLISKSVTWNGNGSNTGFVGDFNGDGKNDILQSNNHVYYGTATGFSDAGNSGLIYNTSMNNFVGDFNGDGLSDFFAASSQGGTIYYYNTQTRTFSSSKPVSGLVISNGCYPNQCVWQGDFNGDGLSDLCSSMGTNAYVNFGNPTNGLNSYIQQNNLAIYKGNTYAADFNGDGLTDIFSCNPSTGYLTISNWSDSTGFRGSITIPNMNFTISSTQSYTWVADYNGDGLADILAKGTDGTYRIYYANGHGFQSGKNVTINLNATAVWPADFNHDGLMDFFVATSNNGQIYYSDGIDFNTQEPVNYAFQPQYTWLGDFNGDGLTDLFNCFSKQVFYGGSAKTSNQTVNQQGDLITAINNGIGSVFTATYKPITDSTVYLAGGSIPSTALEGQRVINAYNAFPLSSVQNQLNGVISIQQAMYVVSDWSETDGRGATYPYQCEYGGAKYDMTGYGFLGYEFSQTTNISQGAVSKKFMLQDFPFTGMTDSMVFLSSGGEIYESQSYRWDSVPMRSATSESVYQVLQKWTNNYSFYQNQLSCKGQQQNWYDAYGNVKRSSATGNMAYANSLWTNSTYFNDTSSWLLGYLTSSKQSSDSLGVNTLSAARVGYNPQMDVDSTYTWFSSTNDWLTRTYAYDPFGNQTIQTSYSGDTSRVAFDNVYHSFPIQQFSPRNAQGTILQTSSVYDPAYGNVVESTDANGNKFGYVFDGLGRMREAWIPDSTGQLVLALQTQYFPASTGYEVRQTTLRSWAANITDSTVLYYDGLSRKYQTKGLGWNNKTVYGQQVFNSSNQITAQSSTYFSGATPVWGHNYYDPAGRLVRQVSPFQTNDSIVTKIYYQGLTTKLTRAAGTSDSTMSVSTIGYYGNTPRLIQFTNASGKTTSYNWDLLGRIISATDPSGNVTAAAWNSLNANDWYYSDSFDTTFFYYNPQQQTEQVVDALHNTITRTYDNLGRLLSSTASGTNAINYHYDLATVKNGLANLCNVTQDNGQTQYYYSYDALGNCISQQVEMDGHTWKQQSTYNPDFSIASLIFPNGMQAEWQYNPAGQPMALYQKMGGNAQTVTSLTGIDAEGNWLNYRYGNGVTTQKQFYTDGTLQNINVTSPSLTSYLSKGYSWTKHRLIGGISDALNASESETYSYNPIGRLLKTQTSLSSDSFAYDNAGNLTWADSTLFSYTSYQVKTGTFNSKTIYAAQYDADGQLTNRTVEEQGISKAYRYSYNAYGQMDSVYRNDSLVYVFTYDYTGSRNRTNDVLKNTINYQVFGSYSQMISATSQHESCNFSMGGVVFASFSSADSAEYYTYNQNSSTVLVTGSKGNLVQRLSYSPYGKFKRQTSDSAHAQYKFNGKEYDEGSGLYYFNFRYYDPFSCRFASPDDQMGGGLSTPDALNNYAFVNNSPITLSDPSGHVRVGTEIVEEVEEVKEVVKLLGIVTSELIVDGLTDGTATGPEVALDAKLITNAIANKTINTATKELTTPISETVESKVETSEEVQKRMEKKRSRTYYEDDSNDDLSDDDGDGGDDDDGDGAWEPPQKKKKVERPNLRQATRDAIWNSLPADADGKKFCPAEHKCKGIELKNEKIRVVSKSNKVKDRIDWDAAHKNGWEYAALYELHANPNNEITWAEMTEIYNDASHYQPECPACNTSHKGEMKNKGGALQNWKNFINGLESRADKPLIVYCPDDSYRYFILAAYRRPEEDWLEIEEQFPYRRAA